MMKVNYLLCYVASLHKTKGVVPLTSGHLHTVTLTNGSNTIIICDEVVKYLQMHYFTTWFLYSYMYTTQQLSLWYYNKWPSSELRVKVLLLWQWVSHCSLSRCLYCKVSKYPKEKPQVGNSWCNLHQASESILQTMQVFVSHALHVQWNLGFL